MLDKMKQCPVFDDGSHTMFSTTMKRIEDLQQNNRKQSPIKANFNKKLLNTFESILCQRILLHVQVPSLSFTILVKKSMNNIFWLKFHEKLLQTNSHLQHMGTSRCQYSYSKNSFLPDHSYVQHNTVIVDRMAVCCLIYIYIYMHIYIYVYIYYMYNIYVHY